MPLHLLTKAMKSCPVRAMEDNFATLRGMWIFCGSYGVYVAVTVSWWLLRGLCGCYVVHVQLFFMKIALRWTYVTDLRQGVTMVEECMFSTSKISCTQKCPIHKTNVSLKMMKIIFYPTNSVSV